MKLLSYYYCIHIVIFYFSARPNFNDDSCGGIEGGTITGNLEIPGLSGEGFTSGSLKYEIRAFDALARFGKLFALKNCHEHLKLLKHYFELIHDK